ncbi:MAG TPA: DUF2892 domain-containing protein [Burkholderiales bacterium]|nr:DUF2892 domain-containing protein [Burkholderiales bacterium]
MKRNEGTADRVIRVAAGLLILSLFFFVDGNARWFALIGIVPVLTGLAGYCPVYSLFGISTCPMERKAT